jgi:hypothetical protein
MRVDRRLFGRKLESGKRCLSLLRVVLHRRLQITEGGGVDRDAQVTRAEN